MRGLGLTSLIWAMTWNSAAWACPDLSFQAVCASPPVMQVRQKIRQARQESEAQKDAVLRGWQFQEWLSEKAAELPLVSRRKWERARAENGSISSCRQLSFEPLFEQACEERAQGEWVVQQQADGRTVALRGAFFALRQSIIAVIEQMQDLGQLPNSRRERQVMHQMLTSLRSARLEAGTAWTPSTEAVYKGVSVVSLGYAADWLRDSDLFSILAFVLLHEMTHVLDPAGHGLFEPTPRTQTAGDPFHFVRQCLRRPDAAHAQGVPYACLIELAQVLDGEGLSLAANSCRALATRYRTYPDHWLPDDTCPMRGRCPGHQLGEVFADWLATEVWVRVFGSGHGEALAAMFCEGRSLSERGTHLPEAARWERIVGIHPDVTKRFGCVRPESETLRFLTHGGSLRGVSYCAPDIRR